MMLKLLNNKRLYAGLVLAAMGALMMPTTAFAGDKVYSPTVDRGELELESRLLFGRDGSQNHVFEIGYGMTSYWTSAVLLEVEREPGERAKAEHISWENIFRLTPQGKYFVDVGAYLELEAGLNGAPDEIEARLLLEKQLYKWTATANIKFTKEVSGQYRPGLELGVNARLLYRVDSKFQPGVEYYSAFGPIKAFEPAGEQTHLFGPAILGRLPVGPGKIKYDLAYLRGLNSGTPSSNFQVNFEYEIRF